jgi:hypothetical protein
MTGIPTELPTEPKIGQKMQDDASRGNDRAAYASDPTVGAVMKDGTLYAGISPDTGKPMYAMPADAPKAITFKEARRQARNLGTLFHKKNSCGHDDWRVPTKQELNMLFNNRAAIGNFKADPNPDSCWYWSGSESSGWSAWGQRFSDGFQANHGHKGGRASVRFVR